MKVYITVPNLHWIHKTVANVLLKLLVNNLGYNLKIDFPTYKPFENNLHHCVENFIKGDFDYWLSIDSDNPPINNPLELIELDKDIIGLPTPIWHFTDKKGERPIYWNAYKYIKERDRYTEWSNKQGLQKVDAIGTGCLIISRRVFQNQEMRKAPFQRTFHENGIMKKGNDIAFCERARKQGFEIWANYDYPCMHFSEIELNQINNAINNLSEK